MAAMADTGEASGGEELTAGVVPAGRASLQGGAVVPADNAQRRRPGGQEVREVVDELAQETRRTSLLDRVEQQLRDQQHVSRLLFGFSITDDRKIHVTIEQEFNAWRERQEQKQDGLSGVLVFLSQAAAHFLEGPTEMLFKALEFFETLSQEDTATARPALIGPLRILHFTELHGVRTSSSWCSLMHPGKAGGGQVIQIEDGNSSECAFVAYKKMLVTNMQVREKTGDDAGVAELQSGYKQAFEQLPTVDEVNMLMGKLGAEYFFTYPEFEKVFVAPFHLKLHSELLWPMPPDLSY